MRLVKGLGGYEIHMDEEDVELLNDALTFVKVEEDRDDLNDYLDILIRKISLKLKKFLREEGKTNPTEATTGEFTFLHPDNIFVLPFAESVSSISQIPPAVQMHLANLPENVRKDLIKLLERKK